LYSSKKVKKSKDEKEEEKDDEDDEDDNKDEIKISTVKDNEKSTERVEQLERKLSEEYAELKILELMKPETMWLSDLDDFDKTYKEKHPNDERIIYL
jgi:hypothetical protein